MASGSADAATGGPVSGALEDILSRWEAALVRHGPSATLRARLSPPSYKAFVRGTAVLQGIGYDWTLDGAGSFRTCGINVERHAGTVDVLEVIDRDRVLEVQALAPEPARTAEQERADTTAFLRQQLWGGEPDIHTVRAAEWIDAGEHVGAATRDRRTG